MLNRRTYFIREHVGFLKLSDAYDILDPETKAQIGIAREEPGSLVHVLRFLLNKQFLPTKVVVYESDGAKDDAAKAIFSIHRGITLFRSKVSVRDANGNEIGWLKSKMFTLGGAFAVFDAMGNEVALVKGDWKGWNFRFLDNQEKEIGTITKKWAGLGKELFTTADNYIISLNEKTSQEKAMLLLAAGLAVDIVYKEK
jgi:uncharacterized protein YxjI